MAIVTIGSIGALTTIREVQQALVRLGYSVGPAGADNILGPATAAAVRKFQADVFPQAGPIDGKPGPITRAALEQRIAALVTPPSPAPRLSVAVGPAGAYSLSATSARAVAAQLAAQAQAPPKLSDLLRPVGGADIVPPDAGAFESGGLFQSAPSFVDEGLTVAGQRVPTLALVAGAAVLGLGVLWWMRRRAA